MILSENVISNWRHALHASESGTIVRGNRISDFHQVAIVINKALGSPVITGNTIESANPQARIATIDGEPASLGSNQLDRPVNSDR